MFFSEKSLAPFGSLHTNLLHGPVVTRSGLNTTCVTQHRPELKSILPPNVSITVPLETRPFVWRNPSA